MSYAIPVAMNYVLSDSDSKLRFLLHAETVSNNEEESVQIAEILARIASFAVNGTSDIKIIHERTKTAEARSTILGPYLYIITKSNRVSNLSFAANMDEYASKDLQDAADGFSDDVFAVIMDLSSLASINSTTISVLLGLTRTMNLYIYGVQENILSIFKTLGVDNYLEVFENLFDVSQKICSSSNK